MNVGSFMHTFLLFASQRRFSYFPQIRKDNEMIVFSSERNDAERFKHSEQDNHERTN